MAHERVISKFAGNFLQGITPSHKAHYTALLRMLENPRAYSYVLDKLAFDFYEQHRNLFRTFPWNLYFAIKGNKNTSGGQNYFRGKLENLVPISPQHLEFRKFEEDVFSRLTSWLYSLSPPIKEAYGSALERLRAERQEWASLIELRYADGMRTLESIGADRGTTKEAPRQMEKRALEKLKGYEEIIRLDETLPAA